MPFSPVERIAKDLERRFNYLKYQIQGNSYKAWTCTFPIGGHQDVVGSFLRGAAAYPNIEIKVNPSKRSVTDSVVYVSSGWRALRDAINLKHKGKINKLISGAVSDHIDDYDGIILDNAIDACIVPCEWFKAKYECEAAEKKVHLNNVKVWPVGVDHVRWTPIDLKYKLFAQKALVYVKGRGIDILERTESLLTNNRIIYKKIYCGSHTQDVYKELLEWCDFMVYLGYSETQGLALAQAWSMNRPTFVYEPDFVTMQGLNAAPYLTQFTGCKWRDISELDVLLNNMRSFSPRKWVLEHQTDAIAFKNFLKIVDEIR